MYRRALVIADDFTGANDTIAQFAKLGFKAVSMLAIDNLADYLSKYDAIAISTESRADDPVTAYRKLFEVGLKVKDLDNVLLYKKVDSTLRGNITEEVKGLYDAVKPDLVVFAPAYPKQGRVTINGIHLVNGVPLDQTPFTKDLRAPAKSSDIRYYFEGVFGKLYTHVYLDELRSGSFKEKLEKYKVVSFDVENENDLRTVVEPLVDYSGKIIWVGSAGLAEALASTVVLGEVVGKPMLLVIGSLSDVTKNQLSTYLRLFRCKLVKIGVREILTNFNNEYRRIAEEVAEALKSSLDIVITTSYYQDQVVEGYTLASELSTTLKDLGNTISKAVSKVIARLILDFNEKSFSGIFATGGDTAMAVVKSLGINSLEVVGEIEPGIPLLKYGDLFIVTKAGGFGGDLTIARIAARIKGASKWGGR